MSERGYFGHTQLVVRVNSQPIKKHVRDYIPEDTARFLPESAGGWLFCGFFAIFDVAPFIFIYFRLRGH